MTTLPQDFRFAFRVLAKSPVTTVVATITLALGIGMTTAIFSVVYGVLLRRLPYERPEQIVELHEVNGKGRQTQFADPNFEDIRSDARSLVGVAEFTAVRESVSGGTEPTRTMVAAVSRDIFPVLRVNPVWGRGFRLEEHTFGAPPVALVGYGYWKQFLGGARDLSSRKLRIENQMFSVVGVLPPQFKFPADAEVWVPREIYERYPSRTAHNFQVVARLRDGVALAEARAELQTIATRLAQQYGQDTTMKAVAITPLRDELTSGIRQPLWILFGAVGLLLLLACANVANLLLVQSAARAHEIGVRVALGATRRRIVRQLIVEAMTLSAAGGIVGVFAAFWGVNALLATASATLPRAAEISINVPVLVFAVITCGLVASALGVFSGLRSTSRISSALAPGSRSQVAGSLSQRTSRAIVAGQLAITVALLASAGLLGRSLLHVLSVDPGFRTERVMTMKLALPGLDDAAASIRRVQFLDELFSRIRRIPGVQDVGGTSNLPLTGFHPDGTYIVMKPGESLPASGAQLEQLFHDRTRTGGADYASVDAGYFRVLGIPLVRGRLFDARDTMDSPHVALISESVVRERWPDQEPLGRQIEFGNMDGDLRTLTVIGVVGDVRSENLERPASPAIYVNCRQRPQATSDLKVVISGSDDTGLMITHLRQIVRDLDPDVPPEFATLADLASGSVQGRRFNVILLAVFAGTALVLAIAGLYGVMAYSVTRRTAEIGVRMALGATRTVILQSVLGEGLLTAAIGVGLGMAASLALTRVIGSMLFGVSRTDPLTFTGVACLLMITALVASYVPARRATRIDPMTALRQE
jgi:putative ABC transport system permease protein